MRELNLDAPAMLEKAIVRGLGHGKFEVLGHRLAYRGTLLRCLHRYELKSAAQKCLYSILVSEKARIEWREIDQIIAHRLTGC
jgi:hypothetical protein